MVKLHKSVLKDQLYEEGKKDHVTSSKTTKSTVWKKKWTPDYWRMLQGSHKYATKL